MKISQPPQPHNRYRSYNSPYDIRTENLPAWKAAKGSMQLWAAPAHQSWPEQYSASRVDIDCSLPKYRPVAQSASPAQSLAPEPAAAMSSAVAGSGAQVHPLELVPYGGHSLWSEVAANFSRDEVAACRLELKAIEHYQAQLAQLKTPEEFQAQTAQLRSRLSQGASLEEIRPQAFALARLAAQATLGKCPYDSQMLGALAMDSGCIAQMGTGEGKTLTALMPLFLHALTGQGSHLVTVNDYLAQAGFDELRPVFQTLGVSVGLVLKQQSAEQKKAGYSSDVTYVSNDTLGFDFLGDRTAKQPTDQVQRPPFFALLDEVDQVLLDEAMVPLIIAGEQSQQDLAVSQKQGQLMAKVAQRLIPGQDFKVDLQSRTVSLTELGEEMVANEVAIEDLSLTNVEDAYRIGAGVKLRSLIRTGQGQQRQALEKLLPPVNLYSEENAHRVAFLENALSAQYLYRKGVEYTVLGDQVQIIDENKGRVSDGRRFMQGLHQALEIKEGLPARPETQTVASITYPKLFGSYPRLAGMTGSAVSARQEFSDSLSLKTIVVPPNRPSQRIDHQDAVFATQSDKFRALADDVQKAFEEGIPVLVATRTVEMNRYLSEVLWGRGIPNQSLNAEDIKTNTPQENALVAQAGQSGVVTVATNMAGRGVDIKPDAINYKKLAMAADQARREGKAVVIVLDPKKNEQLERLSAWFGSDASDPVPFAVATAGSVPQKGQVLLSDQVIGEFDPGVVVLCASDFPGKRLLVLASEHNLERRVDDQLKGRAGRQGAPGETRFYVSPQDEVFSGLPDDQRRQLCQTSAESVREAVVAAQEGIETSHADARYATAQFDAVAGAQREIIWEFRDRWLQENPQNSELVASTVREWVQEAFCRAVEGELQQPTRPSGQDLASAVESVSKKWDCKIAMASLPGGKHWKEGVGSALMAGFHLDQGLAWTVVRDQLDAGWTDQLVSLEIARDNSKLKTFIGQEPEQAFKEEAYQYFGQMWDAVKERVAAQLLASAPANA